MSDPIRSISQNNFILADQKEVSHDNTLRGNGTPESPLGVSDAVMVSSKLDITNNKITGYDGVPIGGSSDTWTDVTSSISSVKSGIKMYYNSALKLVHICGQYSHVQPAGNYSWVICGTIASGYRPKANQGVAASPTDTTTREIARGYIDTNGVIRVTLDPLNQTKNMCISCTYCV